MRPDESTLRDFLARAGRRLTWLGAARGASVAVAVAAILVIAGWPRATTAAVIALTLFLGIVGLSIGAILAARRKREVARLVELRAPVSRNVILTANELLAGNTGGYVSSLVLREAARVAATLNPAALFPGASSVAALVAALAFWAGALGFIQHTGSTHGLRGAVAAATGPSVQEVSATVTPPSYTGQAAQTLRDPARIEGLAGSRLRFAIRAHATQLVIETARGFDTLSRDASGQFARDIALDADGFIALSPILNAQAGERRLIGLTAIPDNPPHVRITVPGHDIRLRDARGTLQITADASDDIGLASLRLHYTKVSGSGERFTFAEGDVPLQVARTSDRAWTAKASWRLDSLELGPGDMVVYKAIATDRRPGAPPAESDALIAEVESPGGIAAAGFETDPEHDRYAVSQQMVIQKTQQLIEKRSTISPDAFAGEAQEIEVEQRKVRAEFVFMLGGELADAADPAGNLNDLNEEAEAEGEGDLAAGRNANAGHIALLRAIRAMSRASTALTVAKVDTALVDEKAALVAIESAFSRARILLRALSTHEALDLTRRMSGAMTDAASTSSPAVVPAVNPRVEALRRVLSDVAALSTQTNRAGARASDLAVRVLQIDAGSRALQQVADALNRGALDSAARGIASEIRGAESEAPRVNTAVEDQLLRGALSDALRAPRPRGRP